MSRCYAHIKIRVLYVAKEMDDRFPVKAVCRLMYDRLVFSVLVNSLIWEVRRLGETAF